MSHSDRSDHCSSSRYAFRSAYWARAHAPSQTLLVRTSGTLINAFTATLISRLAINLRGASQSIALERVRITVQLAELGRGACEHQTRGTETSPSAETLP